MYVEIKETMAKITSVTPIMEKHGKKKKRPAHSIIFEFTMSNTVLDELDDNGLREAFYRKPQKASMDPKTKQTKIDTSSVEDGISQLKFPWWQQWIDIPGEEIEFHELHDVTWRADKQDANDIEYVLAALPSNAAQAPIAWMLQEPGQSKRWYTSGETAMQHWVSKGAIATPLYTAPVAPAAAAQPDERAVFEAWAHGKSYTLVRDDQGSNPYTNCLTVCAWDAWQARATAPKATFECAARKQGSVGGNDPADCDWPVCGCDEHANKVIGALEESGALKSTPIYQIGAPGIAGHQVVWWDVPQEEYEREKVAGYMRTGIVYREGE